MIDKIKGLDLNKRYTNTGLFFKDILLAYPMHFCGIAPSSWAFIFSTLHFCLFCLSTAASTER